MSAHVRAGYVHEAVLWRGPEQFLEATVPFVREGVAQGQPVMVATTRERVALLHDVLDGDAGAVRFVDMESLGANPARIIPAWSTFVRAAGGRPCRGIGEPIWPGRSEVEVAECQLHESLLNLAVDARTPLWLRCPYDVGGLPDEVIAEAGRSHPVVTPAGAAPERSDAYAGPQHALSAFAAPLAEPTDVGLRLEFDDGDLRRVREAVVAAARRCGVTGAGAGDLALAVHELAANSVLHGGGRGRLRVWREPGAVVCEVSDTGHVTDPLTGRHAVGVDGDTGRGLWMVNQLCDLVQLRSSASGTVVRVHTWT
jgi:anti-sigma regulatory factor (Ser/Thr protein kinase)